MKAPSHALTLDDARDRHVVVVGYGKSACDVATSLSRVAASVTVVARRLLWKGSKRSLGRSYEDVVLSRLGEAAFRHTTVARPIFAMAQRSTIARQDLDRLGLVPRGRFEDIAQSTISLESDGFHDAVRAGRILVHRDRHIATLAAKAGAPVAVLDDGTVLRAGLVVAATGFHQAVPFLEPSLAARATDHNGDFALYRQILPHDLPRLTFAGYNSSVISALNAEVAAVWTAAHLAGALSLPSVEDRRGRVAETLTEMALRTRGNHARGTSIVPFSLRNIDQMLDDLGAGLPIRLRASQWRRAALPSDYRDILGEILARVGMQARPPEGPQAPARSVVRTGVRTRSEESGEHA